MESYTLIFENETMFRRGCISHQKGDGLVNPIKQFRGKNLRLSSSELLSKRGLVFLRSQTHPKGKKEQFLQFILTWITINSSKGRCTSLLPWRSQCKAQRPGVTHEAGCFAAGAWNPLDEWNCTLWYTRSEPAIGQVKAMRVEVWFATFGACLLYPISERRTILRSGVSQNWKRDSFFFLVAFSLTLRKPREQTTVRSDSSTRQCLWRKNYYADTGNLQMTLTPPPESLGVMTAWVTHWDRHSTRIFKPRILSHGWGLRMTEW